MSLANEECLFQIENTNVTSLYRQLLLKKQINYMMKKKFNRRYIMNHYYTVHVHINIVEKEMEQILNHLY